MSPPVTMQYGRPATRPISTAAPASGCAASMRAPTTHLAPKACMTAWKRAPGSWPCTASASCPLPPDSSSSACGGGFGG
eukprot:scaffold116661_cov42-Phaeocystis_antarctica.AAC.1